MTLAPRLDDRFIIVSARGPHKVLWGGYRWYDLDSRGLGYPDREQLQAATDRLLRLMEEIAEAYPLDPSRLFLGVFSAGAVMSGTLALLHPEQVAGAAMLGGYLPLHSEFPFRPAELVGHPFLIGHGTDDRVIPVSFARAARDYLAETGAALTYREYAIDHQVGSAQIDDLAAWICGILASVTP